MGASGCIWVHDFQQAVQVEILQTVAAGQPPQLPELYGLHGAALDFS